VIRKAELSFDVASPAEALGRVTQIAERHGGFVASSNRSALNGRDASPDTVSVTLRVPSDRFTSVMGELRRLSRGAGVEQISSEDVSEECLDLDARLKTQRALEQQFLEILKRADKVEDALHVQREIATVRGEIERLDGRRRFLAREVSLSTINLTLSREEPLVSASWQDLRSAARRAYADSVDTAAGLVTFSLRAFGALLPVVVLLGLPAFFGLRWLARRGRRLAALPSATDQRPLAPQ
jgi:hypothetical protein